MKFYTQKDVETAKSLFTWASMNCVHWDMEGCHGDCDCCFEMHDAQVEYHRIKRAYQAQQGTKS